MGRRKDDVFVLGGESFADEHTDTQESAVDRPGGVEYHSAQSSGIRRLGVLGLAAGIVSVVAALALSAGDDGESPQVPVTSSASPLVGAAAPASRPAPRVHVIPRPTPKSRGHGHRSRKERERETTNHTAHTSSSVYVPAPAPATVPLYPSAPPPLGGGVPGGGEEFGFER